MARSSDAPFPLSLLRDRTFQAREIRRVVKLSAFYLVATTILVGLFYHQMLGRLIDGMAPLLFVSEDAALATEAVPGLGEVLGRWLAAMLVVNAVVTAALGVWITRRLGHPLMAIKRALREVAAGNLAVRLRASDDAEFGELAAELAEAMARVREHVAEAKDVVAGAQASGDGTAAGTAALADCRAALEWFRTEPAAAGANDPDARDPRAGAGPDARTA